MAKNTPCSCGCGDTISTCKCPQSCSCKQPGGSCYKPKQKGAMMEKFSAYSFGANVAALLSGAYKKADQFYNPQNGITTPQHPHDMARAAGKSIAIPRGLAGNFAPMSQQPEGIAPKPSSVVSAPATAKPVAAGPVTRPAKLTELPGAFRDLWNSWGR